MNDHDDHIAGQLGTLLHDRVRNVHPDLARLASTAIRAGGRVRRRRQLSVASTTLAGVAAAAALGAQLWPTDAPAPGAFAVAPSPSLSPSTSPGPSTTATQAGCPPGLRVANLHGGTASDQAQSPCSGQTPEPQHLPVSFNAPGWTCHTPADDKFACRDGASSVLVTLRPAQFHADYLSDPDKVSPTQLVSDVHNGFFATIELVSGNVSVDQLAEYLVWD